MSQPLRKQPILPDIIPPARRRNEKAPRNEPPRLFVIIAMASRDDQVCWIAESSQLLPRGRRKVHTSVTSIGWSLPSTSRPVVRSRVLSTSEYPIATLQK